MKRKILLSVILFSIGITISSCNRGNVSSSIDSSSITSSSSTSSSSSFSSTVSSLSESSSEVSFVSEEDIGYVHNNVPEDYTMLLRSDSKCNQSIEFIDTVERNLPEVSSGGLSRYPQYGQSNSFSNEEKAAILAENESLIFGNNTYNEIDSEGNLYLNGTSIGKKLYKHIASVNMYNGNVSDDEQAYKVKVDFIPRELGNYLTGMYAPAGEVIKVEVSQEMLDRCGGGFQIIIGQVSARNHLNDIPSNREYSRMPKIVNKIWINKTVSYVGSFLGGPIYVSEVFGNKPFSISLSGGVKYPYFLAGETTQEEFNLAKKSTAPYFDFEVYDDGVRHTGPRQTLDDLTYYDIFKAGILWENLASVSNRISSASYANYGISFVYDTYVSAGGAVALVGANWCNLPISWMRSGLDYDSFIYDGAWGTVHEYNHHYQMFGIIRGNEVTNNAVNLLEYALFTNISSRRSEDDKTIWDWNVYTDAHRALRILLDDSAKTTEGFHRLSIYATLLHSFGVDKFIQAADASKAGGMELFYDALCRVTGYNMQYFFETLLHYSVSGPIKASYGSLPNYVPVASLYQTGVYQKDGSVDRLMRPFEADSDTVQLDLKNNIIVPNGITYRIKELSPSNGSIISSSDDIYTVKMDKNHMSLDLTLELTSNQGFEIEDVKLLIELQQKNNGFKVVEYQYEKVPSFDHMMSTNFSGSTILRQYNSDVINVREDSNIVYQCAGKLNISLKGIYKFKLQSKQVSLAITHKGITYVPDESGEIRLLIDADDEIYISTISVGESKLYYSYCNMDYELFSFKTIYNEQFLYNNNYQREYGASFPYERYDYTIESYNNFTPWDNNYVIENMLTKDGVYMHGRDNVTVDKPFEVVLDLGEVKTFNNLKFHGYYMDYNEHIPVDFKLYVGDSLESMELLEEYKNLSISNKQLNIKFNETTARYVKLVITRTSSNKYVGLDAIDIYYQIDKSIHSASHLEFRGDVSTISDYNNVYGYKVKTDSASINIETDGLGLVLSGNGVVEISIDGNKKQYDINSNMKTIYEKLSDGMHTLEYNLISGDVVIEYVMY